MNDTDTDDTDHCEDCGVSRESEPLRAVRMQGGDRELLCEACFEDALDDKRVHGYDERVRTRKSLSEDTGR